VHRDISIIDSNTRARSEDSNQMSLHRLTTHPPKLLLPASCTPRHNANPYHSNLFVLGVRLDARVLDLAFAQHFLQRIQIIVAGGVKPSEIYALWLRHR